MSPSASYIDVNALMRGLVHELRNPLSAILTAASLLQSDQELDEESVMLIDVVQKESRRMNRILTEFSSFVKPPTSHPEPFDITKTLRDLTREMQKEGALGSHIELRDELPTQLMVFADPIQSYQALQHIFTNAAQAMENGGTLALHTQNEGENAVIILEDNGAGLSESALERAFQPFFSTKATATGLGLSIAGGLLRASGGGILVENRDLPHGLPRDSSQVQSHGARVRVHLPRAENAANPNSP
ncbi:Histidine kinase-, DNA gyrase B-, and HSP90-like ATPase [Abditibacterium utsteinense]|uniref:histidine kinase n=1 Tax=Abditibacterium utsteinense TaxID=1960156 RepID=A0A2S8SUT4_9BACT|nr:ATP-binding protein [Abditibacterium utsteinense]PQV64557.1 Histidine kinase-, DNA gyrase B-, and HSP90-like ATPase [Abditibacterium utsteinense]